MRSPSTHISLLERLAQDGDEEAWAIFSARYGALIRDYGRRRGLQSSDRDDLLQTVLLSLSKAMPGFRYDESRGRLRSYLKAVTMRAISKMIRQRPETIELVEREEDHQHEDENDERWEMAWRQHHVRRALERLARECNQLNMTTFRLHVLEGRSAEEVTQLLGVSVEVVYQSKSRLLKRLTEIVEGQVREEG